MSTTTPAIAALKGDDTTLTLTWSDGAVHTLPWRLLRDACPCATCRAKENQPPAPTEPGALPVLSAAEAQPLRVLGMKPVGNYAYAINFSDGHTSGIYSVDYLRRLGEEVSAVDQSLSE